MKKWPSSKARDVLAALAKIGWRVKRQTGSHKVLERPGLSDVVFAFHNGDEIGPRTLARIGKQNRIDAGRPVTLTIQVHPIPLDDGDDAEFEPRGRPTKAARCRQTFPLASMSRSG
jgi:predicted RNA binding protein YcfA (HicA-like mRNA interferase family)